jgi:hypothetical protein
MKNRTSYEPPKLPGLAPKILSVLQFSKNQKVEPWQDTLM